MSKCESMDISCPKCGLRQSITVWDSVNVMLNPELRDKVISGMLNIFSCQACGQQIGIQKTLLYHDMLRKYMVWYIPPDEKGRVSSDPEMRSMTRLMKIVGLKNFDYKFRVVSSQAELAETIQILDDGLDDRIVEMMKLQFEQYFDGYPGPDSHSYYIGMKIEDGYRYLKFFLPSLPNSEYTPQIDYDDCARAYEPFLAELSSNNEVLRVGRKFAKKVELRKQSGINNSPHSSNQNECRQGFLNRLFRKKHFAGKKPALVSNEILNEKDGAEMVWVPEGEFIMGSTDEQVTAALEMMQNNVVMFHFDCEKPQRKVYLDGYWMYKYEVTVAQYMKFCEATKREIPKAPSRCWKENHPMVNVTWQDATDYAEWAKVSLPTEAQWEKAARGTDGRSYPWGNDWDALKCANRVGKVIWNTQPIGSYPSDVSPYGCMDMAGNVNEWCADWYDPNYYVNASTKNPSGPSGEVKFELVGLSFKGGRVLRGGTWDYYNDGSFRCAYRNDHAPALREGDIGFRCAKNP